MGEPLALYRFRFRDPVTGRWQRARYRASLADIRGRYAEWVLEGEPERRATGAPGFDPFAARAPASAPAPRQADVEVAEPTRVDALEAALLACFLRRYVTYCARRRRFAAMNGAARLLRRLQALPPVVASAGNG